METAASSSREPKYGIRDNEVCLAGFVFSCRKRSYVPTAVHREPNRVAEKTVQTVVMLLTTVLVLCLITLSLIWAPWPYFGVFLSLAYLAVRITLEKKEERIWRIFFLNASVLLLLLTLFEGGLELHQWIKKARTPQVKTSSHKLFGEDEQFGKAAQESARVSFSVGGTKVYDVQYTIDEYKLRETPAEGRVGKPAVVLFGCSITFGEGVEDDEAFPYILAEKFKTEKRVLNFAFSGYGTNHMLTWLRSDRMQPAQRGSIPETVLYVFIKDHVRRACGQVRFAARSPSFLLQSDGSLTRDGLFNEPKLSSSFFRRLLRYELDRSQLGLRLFPYERTNKDLEFWAKMVMESKNEVHRKWPEARFIAVYFWHDKDARELAHLLEERGVEVVSLTEHLPTLEAEKIPHDGHPNASGHRRVAEFLHQFLEEEESP